MVPIPFWGSVSPNRNVVASVVRSVGKVCKRTMARSVRSVSRKTQFDFQLPVCCMQNFKQVTERLYTSVVTI